MNTQQTTEKYRQNAPWQPDFVDKQLADTVAAFHSSQPAWSQELLLARRLAKASRLYLGADTLYNYDIGRASTAIRLGSGNCVAHTEIGLGVSHALNLDMMVHFSRTKPYGWHASTLWVGKTAIWEIDFLSVEGREFGSGKAAHEAAQTLARSVVQTQNNAHYAVNEDQSQIDSFTFDGLPGTTPHEFADKDYDQVGTMAYAEEGMPMLTAWVDYHHLQATNQERLQQLGNQILAFIPPGCLELANSV